MSGRRNERLAEEIREDVARIVGQLKDPRIGFVTVTRVELTPDLRTAHVHVGILGGAPDRQKTLAGEMYDPLLQSQLHRPGCLPRQDW